MILNLERINNILYHREMDYVNTAICGNCMELMKYMPEVEMTLTDIPYDVVSRDSNGLRNLDKTDADELTFDLGSFLDELVRLTRGSIYVFCSTEQVSFIRSRLIEQGLTTRLCIWEKCLSGCTRLYVRSNYGTRHTSLNDLARLAARSKTTNYYENNKYFLWDGKFWNPIVEITESNNYGDIYKITLRSGEVIRTTASHRFLSDGDEIRVKDIKIGTILDKIQLPNSIGLGSGFTKEVPWFIGLYLAEGSYSGTDIQLSLNIDEITFMEPIQKLCADYAGSCYNFVDGNKLSIIVTGECIKSFIRQFVFGKNASEKRLKPKIWDMDNEFLERVFNGYLNGDGGYDKKNDRYRLGFSRNEHLTNDLRTLCARLNHDKLRIVNGTAKCNGKTYLTKQGNLSLKESSHHNSKQYSEVIEIKRVSKRNKERFWDIVLENEPHTFTLASGIMSHNSNPSPMNGQYIWLSGIECCVYGKKKGAVFNEHCKNTVWRYPISRNKVHPTQKPT